MRYLPVTLVMCVLGTTTPIPGAAAQQGGSLAEWRGYLRHQQGDSTMWFTSNADYRNEDGGIDSYAMRFEVLPGGVASRGCLWGIRDGETLGPFWEFFSAWDPIEKKGLLYQVAPGGSFGLGHRWSEDGVEVAEQTFQSPDGSESRIRHETRNVDDDTRVGGSLDWVDGSWVSRRTYRWERRLAENVPC